jgi:hypothetical protein
MAIPRRILASAPVPIPSGSLTVLFLGLCVFCLAPACHSTASHRDASVPAAADAPPADTSAEAGTTGSGAGGSGQNGIGGQGGTSGPGYTGGQSATTSGQAGVTGGNGGGSAWDGSPGTTGGRAVDGGLDAPADTSGSFDAGLEGPGTFPCGAPGADASTCTSDQFCVMSTGGVIGSVTKYWCATFSGDCAADPTCNCLCPVQGTMHNPGPGCAAAGAEMNSCTCGTLWGVLTLSCGGV